MSKVAIIMGSISDMPVMQDAIDILKQFNIEVEVDIVSAHRTPENYLISVKMHTLAEFRLLLPEPEVQHIYQEWLLQCRRFL